MTTGPDDIVTLNRTNRWLVWGGLVPLLQGALFVLVSFAVMAIEKVEDKSILLFPLVGGTVFLVGVILTCGRSGTTIDRRRRLLTRWWGLFKPMWNATFSIEDATHVSLERKRASKGQVRYVVWCCGPEAPRQILTSGSETVARAAADKAARFLQLELRDFTGEPSGVKDQQAPSIRRQPEEIGVAVGERMLSGLEGLELPKQPEKMLSRIEPLPGGLEITLPRVGFTGPMPVLAVMFAFPVVFLAIAPSIIMKQMPEIHDAPLPFSICLYFPALVLGGLLFTMVLGGMRTRLRMIITPHEVRVKGGLWQTGIPFDRLEEVRVEGRGGNWSTPCFVLLRSASAMARFGGNNLSRAECEYLAALVRAAAAAAAKGDS